MCKKNLSETEEKTINHFRYYFNNKKSFALIGEYVVVELADENSGDIAKLEQDSRRNSVEGSSLVGNDSSAGFLYICYG